MHEQRHPTSPRVTGASALLRASLALTAVIATCLGARGACAQDAPPSVTVDVGDCVNLKSPGERLDCYERHVEAARQGTRATPDAPPPAALPTVAAAGTVASAGAAATTTPNAVAPSTEAAPSTQVAPTAVAAAVSSAALASAAPTAAPASSTATAGFEKHLSQAPADIVATVTELHETVPNAWLITLDNGQVWRQNTPQRFGLKAGNHVTLRATTWGTAYRLTAQELHGFIQVERVR